MSDPIVVERFIEASPDDTFSLLTQPERLRRWQALSASVDLRVGGAYRYTIVPGNIAEGTFTEIDPGRRLVLTWAWAGSLEPGDDPSTLIVELEPKDQGTMVRFIHEGLVGDAAASHEDGWKHYIERLEVAATGTVGSADPWAAAPEELDPLSSAEACWAILQGVMVRLDQADRENPTPCSEFTVHELVEHLMGSVRGIGGVAGAEIPDDLHPVSAEDYIARAVEPALSAWRARGVEGEAPFGAGMAPAIVPVGLLSLEFLIHAWDFAQATDAEFDAPDHLVEFVHELATMIIQPDNRGEGRGFGHEQIPSADTPIHRLMAFSGRIC